MDFSNLCIELTLNNQLLNVNWKSLESDCTFKAFLWSQLGSNQRPSDYESDALTDWAMRPVLFYKTRQK